MCSHFCIDIQMGHRRYMDPYEELQGSIEGLRDDLRDLTRTKDVHMPYFENGDHDILRALLTAIKGLTEEITELTGAIFSLEDIE